MAKKRVHYTEQFKVKVVLETLRGAKSQKQIALEFRIHPTQVTQWKILFLDRMALNSTKSKKTRSEKTKPASLYEKIGRLQIENDRLKKRLKK